MDLSSRIRERTAFSEGHHGWDREEPGTDLKGPEGNPALEPASVTPSRLTRSAAAPAKRVGRTEDTRGKGRRRGHSSLDTDP